jgi:hypothetical protein
MSNKKTTKKTAVKTAEVNQTPTVTETPAEATPVVETKTETTAKVEIDPLEKLRLRAEEMAAKAPAAKKVKPTHDCLCGCGTQTKGLWAPGHNGKALSKMVAEIREKKATEQAA